MVALGIPRPVALYWGRRWVRIMRRRRIEAARRIP